MKQIFQNFKTGKLYLAEVPVPATDKTGILVETRHSLVSPGTEKMMIDLARKGLIGKARNRPDLVKQVIAKVKKEGLSSTYKKVMQKLEDPKPLGYSCSGIVVEAGLQSGAFQVGDRVACAGAGYANHADFNFVPRNLAVKIPDGVSLKQASYGTVGAIALQGVRQAEPDIGDVVVVLGLGLLGLLTVQLLRANGCLVVATDPIPARVELAAILGADIAIDLDPDDLRSRIYAISGGNGADSVIITAGTKSNQPLEMAGELARKRGKVVAVGAVSLNVPRNAFYLKELDLRLSMSYGPGRYDGEYEEKGHDYPYSYVRYTEQRNIETVLRLIQQKKLDVDQLTSHEFEFDKAESVYQDLLDGKMDAMGIIFNYAPDKEPHRIVQAKGKKISAAADIRLGLIGAGNYASGVLYPQLIKIKGVDIVGIATGSSAGADKSAKAFHPAFTTTDYKEILQNDVVNVVFITTRHNLHAGQTIAALRAGKHVFVEKPLALNHAELAEVKKAARDANSVLYVGFNRRFSSYARKIKEHFKGVSHPLNMIYRVNAGVIPMDHWIQDPETGGGRIIGEVCHFVDLFSFLSGSVPQQVYAAALDAIHTTQPVQDNISITIKYADGSIGTIIYLASGDPALGKEYLELHSSGRSAILRDFSELELFSNGKRTHMKHHLRQDKGQQDQLKSFLEAIRGAGPSEFSLEDICRTTEATFCILESLSSGKPVQIVAEEENI